MRILVTGASGGIGSALVQLAKSRGDYVVGISRTPSAAHASYQCDVLDVSCLSRVAAEVGQLDGIAVLHGHGDAALWNKGIEELTADDFVEVYKVDVAGAFNVVKAFRNNLKPTSSLVFVSSTPGLVGDVYGLPYAAAKGAIVALVKSLAKILAPVKVNAVAFGPIETRWMQWITAEEVEEFKNRTLLRRMGTPAEAAEAIYWLLSPASSYITGQVIVVDGGETLAGLYRPIRSQM